jgi:hypothetical protein
VLVGIGVVSGMGVVRLVGEIRWKEVKGEKDTWGVIVLNRSLEERMREHNSPMERGGTMSPQGIATR